MPKHAKPINNNKRKSSNSKHGSTLCQWCFKKIAKGMYYCNNKCRERSDNYRKASQPINKGEEKEDISFTPVEMNIRPIRQIGIERIAAIYKGIK
jgi:hypothetical protein